MGYYDNVKDSVKDDDSGNKANFDSLRKAAEETSEEEKEGDDTSIEVLEEGISKEAPGKTQKEKRKQEQQETDQSPDAEAGGSKDLMPSSGSSTTDSSSGQESSSSTGSSLPGGSSVSPGSNSSSRTDSGTSSSGSRSSSGDLSAIERKLDEIIDQNERMIRILEGFGS